MLTAESNMQRKGGKGALGPGGAEVASFEVPTSPLVKAAVTVVAVLAVALVGITLYSGRGQIVKAIAGARAHVRTLEKGRARGPSMRRSRQRLRSALNGAP